MKQLSLLLSVLLLAVRSSEAASASPRASSSPPQNKFVLRMNDYYVPYMIPKAPYIDEKGRLMVPLRAFAEQMGADVAFDAQTKTATVAIGDQGLRAAVGQSEVWINGRTESLESTLIADQGSLIAPVRLFVDAFALQAKTENGVVALTDDRFFTAGRFRTFSDEDIGRSRLLDPSAFRPLWFTLQERTVSLLKPNDTLQYTFAMAAQNQTGKPIEAGHEDLHAIYSFADDKSSASDFDGLPTPGYAGTPASGGCPR